MSKILPLLKFKEILCGGKSYSQSDLTGMYERFGEVLQSNNMTSPFVFLRARNEISTITAFLALRKVGMVCVLIDPLLKDIELQEYREHLQPWAMIDHRNGGAAELSADDITLYSYEKRNPVDHYFLEGVCIVMFSSGEDGRMKPVVITEDNMLSDMYRGTLTCDIVDETRTSCGLLPFYHVFGLMSGMIIPILTGGRVLVADVSDVSRITSIAQQIHELGVTNVYSVPLIYYMFSRVKDVRVLLSGTKTLYSGGYKLTKDVSEIFFAKTGKEIHEGYGMSETTATSIGHKVCEPSNSEHLGRPVPVNQLRIVDTQGCDLPVGQTGEIWLKGDNVTRGFYGMPVATARHITDGWLHTGDLAHLDDQGHVYFDGLRKRMFNIAGKNVYPAEVERLIELNPNVISATIAAQPNGIFGDKLLGTILLRDNSSEQQKALQDWCHDNITQFKLPRQWTFL